MILRPGAVRGRSALHSEYKLSFADDLQRMIYDYRSRSIGRIPKSQTGMRHGPWSLELDEPAEPAEPANAARFRYGGGARIPGSVCTPCGSMRNGVSLYCVVDVAKSIFILCQLR